MSGASDPVSQLIYRKLDRLAQGGEPRVLDLFSGCGGMSLGFQSVGFRVAANVEIEPDAARSHALNFHNSDATALALHGRARDITVVQPADLCAELDLGPVDSAIDVIIGGPPCQAYARVGRAKLRHLTDNPRAFQDDARRILYRRYLHYVGWFRPIALVMENVPDILNQEGHNVVQEIVAILRDLGYETRYSLLNAAHFGVPQTRDRVFMIAVRRELGVGVQFPPPSHRLALPPGYASSRGHSLKVVLGNLDANPDFVATMGCADDLPDAVSAGDALDDLPILLGTEVTRNGQVLGESSRRRYALRNPRSDYAALMRSWPGFETTEEVLDHVTRRLPRDGRIFACMPEGAEYPVAHALAVKMFERATAKGRIKPGSEAYDRMRAAFVPPYDPGKFPNKWWKMRRDAPVRTLMAHLGRDCYSHIHYDDVQARTLTVREAARLQSFPDGFRFSGTLNPVFQQIGNAVPPLMSAAIARTVKAMIGGAMALCGRRTPDRALAA